MIGFYSFIKEQDKLRSGKSVKCGKNTVLISPNSDELKESDIEEGAGLYANIHAKRKRGEAPAKPGSEDYPAKDAFKKAEKTAKEEYDVESAEALWSEVGERLEKLGEMDGAKFKVIGEKTDSSYLETDMKKRAANNQQAIDDMKKTKAHKDMVAAARKRLEEMKDKETSEPEKKKPTFQKSKFIKYGRGYADQGGGSKIRTTEKDWDESYVPEGEAMSFSQFVEARAEDKRGLEPTGENRKKQKTGVKLPGGGEAHPVTSYSGGQNSHTRGKGGGSKEQRRASSRRHVDQPGGVYAKPENKQGEGRYLTKQNKKRDQSHMSSRFD